MKAIIISDQHFSIKNGNLLLDNLFKEYYSTFFFPLVDEVKPDCIIDCGDTFDSRKILNIHIINNCKKYYFDEIAEREIPYYVIQGNHTTYFKNTNEVNSLDLVLHGYRNFHVYSTPREINLCGVRTLMFPWMPVANDEKWINKLKKSNADLLIGHLDIIGADTGHGQLDHGFKPGDFDKFKLVLSGHIHTRQRLGKVQFVGDPYDLNWGEVDQIKGIHILDFDTLDLQFIPSPIQFFHRIIFSNNVLKPEINEKFKGKFIQVIIDNYVNKDELKAFITELNDIAGFVTTKELANEKSSVISEDLQQEITDTPDIIRRFVSNTNYNNKDNLTNILLDLYNKALTSDIHE